MPRGVRGSSASKKGVTTGPPPSHAAETFREHRRFLIRSLDRNDVEISALMELNKSLHAAKETILRSCGERVLLDLGSGRLRLIGEELHEKTAEPPTKEKPHHNLTQAQKEACVDFLLRMKLRRKLSNRLVRRLTRVAHAMDGKDVTPPGPPKYGDLRFKIDAKCLQSRIGEWKEKAAAKQRIDAAIHERAQKSNGEKSSSSKSDKEKVKQQPVDERTDHGGEDDTAEKGKTEQKQAVSDEAKSVDTSKETVPLKCSSAPETVEEIEKRRTTDPSHHYTMPELANDFNLLKEYEEAYEKAWDHSTKSLKYRILKEEIPDPQPGRVGACAVFSSIEDLKTERKRWQTNLLRRIPHQPSMEELGLKNRVFHLEERRKRCLEKTSGEGNNDESQGKRMNTNNCNDESLSGRKGDRQEANEEDDGGSDDMEVDNEENETKDEENSDSEDEKEKEEKTQRKDPIAETMKPKRSISFASIPSFDDQDLARIRLIHKDLLNSSQVELTRKRLRDATDDYNKIYKFSTQLFEARQMIQHNLTFAIAKGRQELQKAHSDYTLAYTAAKQRWIKEKFDYDMKKSQAVLPTKWGNRPLGTEVINNYMNANYSSVHRTTVAQTLADIVDGCVLAGMGKADIQRFRDFEPPPAPGMNVQTGENMAQRQHRVEMEYRKQYSDIDAKLQKSESDRTRSWRKAMKAQAENNAVCGARGSRVTLSNFHTIPVPVIRSGQQSLTSQKMMQQRAKVLSSSTPAPAPTTATSTTTSSVDMSKYSAEKVKLRKAADGSVAPVSKPKKDKDGLYLRPAGRTRKGMQWDAVNGVWIPQQQPSQR
eukprot:jgi/Psemu1/259606/estExt_Genewise1Plus.C_3630027